MKKYTNIFVSLVAYAIAVLSVVFTGKIKTATYFLFAILGIVFAFIASRSKESSWGSNLLIILGILGMLYPLVAWTGDY